jgi:hypothetical protein
MLAGRRFDVHCFEQADAHHLGDPARVIAVRLVDAGRKRCMHMPGLDTNGCQANLDQTCVNPLRQWTSFQTNTLNGLTESIQTFGYGTWLTIDHRLKQNLAVGI